MRKRGGKSSGSTSGSFSGTGTWFIPSTEGGSEGACGGNNKDNAPIVAMNKEQYGDTSSKSQWCGKKLKITSGGKSTTATVTDACPECKKGDLDLTTAVFKKLGDLDKGVLDITWEVAGDD
ncbi:RlpA-like double-psi beta-barrel-protein domain-containing protein-containing protein [Syncephalastrum racemosum]|uniref:RlpA-like double-psi beta-barrel-protein domain-containing protein-containing protein n=1 Tax=Syncephalastrum racemosum TaxID=13706 RepID=A0A1X2HJ91_SYNRA|nr:RlpA-like double-psi beta-barrel-protein domain-containing protein-containing protein [Syncephalastrum racemosum]